MFFSQKKTFWFKVLLRTHGMQFWHLCRFVSPETRNILAQSPKVWKVLFVLEKCPSESSTWHLECLPDEPGVFLQIEVSSEKPWNYNKLYLLSSSKNFFKTFYWSPRFQFWHPCWKVSPKIRNFYIQISKQSQNNVFLSRKSFLTQSVSLNTWHAVLKSLLKLFRQEIGNFSLLARKAKTFGLWQIFLLKIFLCTRRVPS